MAAFWFFLAAVNGYNLYRIIRYGPNDWFSTAVKIFIAFFMALSITQGIHYASV